MRSRSVIIFLALIMSLPLVSYAQPEGTYTLISAQASYNEHLPDTYRFRIYTGGAKQEEADHIAFEYLRNFLYQHGYAYYKIISRPIRFNSAYSNYTVNFFRNTKIKY